MSVTEREATYSSLGDWRDECLLLASLKKKLGSLMDQQTLFSLPEQELVL